MDESSEQVNCAICDQGDTEIVVRGTGPNRLVRCRNDGLVYMSPRPSVEYLREFHAHFVRDDNLNIFDGYRRKVLEREAEAIKAVKSGGNLLDIGCATGTLFDNFTGGAWRLYGIDSSSLGVEAARTRYNADVSCGTLREARYPTGFFDVVTVLDTLYYVPDPKAELSEIRRVLKDDGFLGLEIPGRNYTLVRDKGPLCWILDRKWARRSVKSHRLYYFSGSTIRLLLGRTGFSVTTMIPEQASLGGQGVRRALNEMHFDLARLVHRVSRGRVSIAGKEFYLAVKMELDSATKGYRPCLDGTQEVRGHQ